MSVREFRDDDAGYRAWLATHPDGYVLPPDVIVKSRMPETAEIEVRAAAALSRSRI